jgi:hypothetical protein
MHNIRHTRRRVCAEARGILPGRMNRAFSAGSCVCVAPGALPQARTKAEPLALENWELDFQVRQAAKRISAPLLSTAGWLPRDHVARAIP